MITKFRNIKNLAVFKDFDWDIELRDKENNVVLFNKINILYGRNYSGKTTLSRIVRALETGTISDKYENPECCVCITDNTDVFQSDFTTHNKTIRVFNEDFIERHLKFIVNQDKSIQPFAILGGDNNEIEEEIKTLRITLGSNEEEKESALYKDLKSLNALYKLANGAYGTSVSSLDGQLSSKATNNPNGIKYQSDKYGDQNYTITKLKAEIGIVNTEDFTPISDEEKTQAEKILTEKAKKTIPELAELVLKINDFTKRTEELVNRKIGQSNKIENLVKNAILNRWVKEGKDLHQDKLDVCSFCDNKITESRWEELDKHFDEESDAFENEIKELMNSITSEGTVIKSTSGIKRDDLYSKFHSEIDILTEQYNLELKNYSESLDSLESQLKNRKDDILNEKTFEKITDYSTQVEDIRIKFNELRIKSNEYTENLSSEQTSAKKNLRLKEVFDFVEDIKYDDLITNIETLKENKEAENKIRDEKQTEIDGILTKIDLKQRELKDESKGAEKVNEYLNDYFGHNFLSLKAIKFEEEETGDNKYRFEIQRNGYKAHHLSEGEKSLIAFCYFMAKLQDIDTQSKKPIIWIDDPISSLDGNHVFFVFSLIKTTIVDTNEFEQIFVSTHNLNFLKYLKRLTGGFINERGKWQSFERKFFLVNRIDNTSNISVMPEYLKKYITEFNYLFEQIYKCSVINSIDDTNYKVFYNFGNNARKFLEIYLYYKYPDGAGELVKMKKFFGEGNIPAVLTDRINNEYSHLSGSFERGQEPVEVPEMKRTAELIINKIKEDSDQYEALLRSIGIVE